MSNKTHTVANKSNNRLLDLSDVIQLSNIDNFLKQQPDKDWLNGENNVNESNTKAQKKPQFDDEDEYVNDDQKSQKKEEKYMYSDLDEYICQSPSCRFLERREEIETLHNFEINGEKIITICNYCYDQGYRFCLFTHNVKHLDELDPVLEGMYAQKNYHHNQLNAELLRKIPDLSLYFQIIGIENPYPTYNPIDLTSKI